MATDPSSFINTLVFVPVNYSEIKYVCLANLTSVPTEENYRSVVPSLTEENLNNPNKLILMTKAGGPDKGSITIADTEIDFGIEYEYDKTGAIIVDEWGAPITASNNGVLYHLEVSDNIKHLTFNAIIAYSNEIDTQTKTNSIALVTILNNSLSFSKILNFCIRYIITVDMQIEQLEIDYWTGYNEHNKVTSNSGSMFRKQHPLTAANIVTSEMKLNDRDYLNESIQQYKTQFLEAETLYVAPKDAFDVVEEVPAYELQYLKNVKVNRFTDKVIRSDYVYYYLNIFGSKLICAEGIIDEEENLEDINEFNKVTVSTLRKHIKLGINELNGPYLYTWMSTPKFIYVFIFNSNSNNNIDIYRVKNRNNVSINESSFNLVVGKYLDRIYFTIDGVLYVCLPQTKEKQTDPNPVNANLMEEALKTFAEFDKNIYDAYKTFSTKDELIKEYNALITTIQSEEPEQNVYYITEEQLCVALIGYTEDPTHLSHIENGKYKKDQATQTTAKDYVNEVLGGYTNLSDDIKLKAVQYIKQSTERINSFIDYIDKLIKECDEYESENQALYYKAEYIIQAASSIRDQLYPEYELGDTYKSIWQGNEGTSGVKYDVLLYYLGNGYTGSAAKDPDKYEDYSKSALEKCESVFVNHEFLMNQLDVEYMSVFPIELTDIYYQGVGQKIKEHDPTITETLEKTIYTNFLNKNIYSTDDIFNILSQFKKYWIYSNYRRYYNTSVNFTRNIDNFCLRQFLIAQTADLEEIDELKTMSANKIIEKYENTYLATDLVSLTNGTWWDDAAMNSLEEKYKTIISISCFIEYPYNTKDTFYFEGEKKEDIDLTVRQEDIPYKHGFPYPNYIYTDSYSKFSTPSTPAVPIEAEYKSKTSLEENLMKPKYDGSVETFDDLAGLFNIEETISVSTIEARDNLETPIGSFPTYEEMQESIAIEGSYSTKETALADIDSLIEGKTYFIIGELSYYIFEERDLKINENFPKFDCSYSLEDTEDIYALKRDLLDDSNYYLTWTPLNFDSGTLIVYVDEDKNYYIYNKTWVTYTTDDVEESFIDKIYLVTDTETYYTYSGGSWVMTNPVYDISNDLVFKVTNEPEEVTETIEKEKMTITETDPTSTYKFTPLIKGAHSLSISVTSFDDDESTGTYNYDIKQDSTSLSNGAIENGYLSIEITTKSLTAVSIIITGGKARSITVSYKRTREPGDTGIKYYKWNGSNGFREVTLGSSDLPEIPGQEASKFILTPVYYNIYLEGDKLKVITDLFKSDSGDVLEVVQFDFSDIGDVVLVKNYNGLGENAWGGVFSRKKEANENGIPINWGSDVVISKNFKECFNWESFSNIIMEEKIDNGYQFTDNRLNKIENLYEISRMHYENLKMHFDEKNMRFSNALTLCFHESEGRGKVSIFSKNLKMITNYNILNFNNTKVDVNNYFVILSELWMDLIYRRSIFMDSALGSNYKKIFITASRGSCICAVSPRTDYEDLMADEMNGAYSFFDVNTWYDQAQVLDYLDPNRIPSKDL